MGSSNRPSDHKTHLVLDITFSVATGTYVVLECIANDVTDRSAFERHVVSNTAPGMLRSLLNRRLWDLERIETHRVNPPLVEDWVTALMGKQKPPERL